jgi:hypothetical protein
MLRPMAFYLLMVVAYFLIYFPRLPLMKILPVIASYHNTQ